MAARFALHVEDEFSAAHQLRGHGGRCENLHGHNWRVLITVAGDELLPSGMLIDFADLKKLLRQTMQKFDHQYLNDIPPFDQINPTVELLAKSMGELIAAGLPDGVVVESVTVWESEKCSATWRT